jgi:DnaD/phage-associated family protein
MATIRVRKDARYFSASNEPFNDKRLSWEARGLMGYLLSKPNDWIVRMTDIDNQGPAGSRKIKRMLAELRMYGYMTRIRTKLENGKFEWATEVYESPSQNPHPSKAVITASVTKCTTAICTSTNKPDIVSTESLSTDEPNEEEAQPDENQIIRAEIFKAYENEIGMLTPFIADAIEDVLLSGTPSKWVVDSFREAASQNARSWKYCAAILKRWVAQGNQNPVEKAKPQGKPAARHATNFDANMEITRRWLEQDGANV